MFTIAAPNGEQRTTRGRHMHGLYLQVVLCAATLCLNLPHPDCALACDGPGGIISEVLSDQAAVAVFQLASPPPVARRPGCVSLKVVEVLRGNLETGHIVEIGPLSVDEGMFLHLEAGPPVLTTIRKAPDGAWLPGCGAVRVIGSGLLVTDAVRECLLAQSIPKEEGRVLRLLCVLYRCIAIPDSHMPEVKSLKQEAAQWLMALTREWKNKLPPVAVNTGHLAQVLRETSDGAVAVPLYAILYPLIAAEARVDLLRHIASNTWVGGEGITLHEVIGRDDDVVEKAVLERLRTIPVNAQPKLAENLFRVIQCASVRIREKAVVQFRHDQRFTKQVRSIESALKLDGK